ncbi:hypothetical protein AGMMS49587_09010 [Spirochaetia bacterium]|nr:hypothetical protein AGMMS49587_09010 [Spirochaetia bacterium]
MAISIKFVEMIEKIALALGVEPYRFFVDETAKYADIAGAVSESLKKTLEP